MLTIRFLVSCPSSRSSELLGFIPPWICHQQGAIKLDQDVLDLLLRLLIHILLVVSYQGLGQSLSDGVDLTGVSTALHTDPDVDVGKPVLAQKKDWFLHLEAQICWLRQIQG